MEMRIRNQKDFYAGLMFIGFGAFFSIAGTHYALGSAAKMGPGYFPVALGVILVVLGAIILLGSLTAGAREEKIDRIVWPAMLLIFGPVLLFGLLLNTLGLILCLFLLIVISSYASHDFTWKAALANAAFLIAMSLIVFVWALGLQFPLWPRFVGN